MLTNIIDEEKIREAERYIEEGETFVIVTHVAPDGDALGSSLALYHFIRRGYQKENVRVVIPNMYPACYRWLAGTKSVVIYEYTPEPAVQMIQAADVLFYLDINDEARTDRLADYIMSAGGHKVMIDHHPRPVCDCDVVISHPDMTSTSELIFRFIWQLGKMDEMTKDAAACIYTGMMTDTGAFTYNSSRPEIYTIIGELIMKGIDKDRIYRNTYQVYTTSRLRMQGYALYQKMKVYPNYHAALITLSSTELRHFKYCVGDTDGFVNMPLSIAGVHFSCFLRSSKGYTKVSLRSVGDFPCDRFAAKYFNGGGHKNASGGYFLGGVKDARELFEKALKEFDPSKEIDVAEEKKDRV